MFFKMGALKHSANFTRKHLCWSLLTKLQNTSVFEWVLGNFQEHFLYRPPAVAASESLKNVFVQQIFSLILKLCLHVIHFRSYFFATSMAKMSSRKLSWNSEKPSSRPEAFFNGKRCFWKFRKIHAPLKDSRFLLNSCWLSDCNFIEKRLQYKIFPVNFAKFPRTFLLQKTTGQLLLEITQENL